AGLQIDPDIGGARGQVDLFPRAVRAAGGADAHAVEPHVDVVRVEGGIGGADGGEHPSPVRVVAEDRGLEQVVPCDRAADGDRVVFAGGVDDLDADVVAGALGVGLQLRGEVAAHLGQRGGEDIGIG